MKKHIPNLITCMNVTSGAVAVFLCMYGELEWAAFMVLLAMVFDFFDGFAARLLHVKSELGKELDSLADVVSFGLVPAVLAHCLMLKLLPGDGIAGIAGWNPVVKCCFFAPLLMPAFSAYRLAKFNLDSRQTTSFIGMPTPANALFWVSLVFGRSCTPELYDRLFGSVSVLGVAAVVLSVLLVCELPMFSLKLTGFGWKGNGYRYTYLIILLVLAAVCGKAVLLAVIPLYIFFALLESVFRFIASDR